MKQEQQTKITELAKVILMVNEYFDDDDGFDAEIIENDFAIFPFGEIWICDECDRIHVGFHLDADPSLIGHIAIALYEYRDHVEFDTVPVFVGDKDLFQDDEAFLEYGKSLINSVACNDCTAKIVDAELLALPGSNT